MSLGIGTRVDPYEIIAIMGSVGEVSALVISAHNRRLAVMHDVKSLGGR